MSMVDRPMTPKDNASGKAVNKGNKNHLQPRLTCPPYPVSECWEKKRNCHQHMVLPIAATDRMTLVDWVPQPCIHQNSAGGFVTANLATTGLALNQELKPITNPNYTGERSVGHRFALRPKQDPSCAIPLR